MSDQNTWPVTIPFHELDAMRAARTKAEKRVVELEAEVAQLKLSGGPEPELLPMLAEGLRHAGIVIRWAQGNYDPETVRGWPHQSLGAVLDAILKTPGASQDDKEWADDSRRFVSMAAAVERARRLGRQKELAQIPRETLANPTAYERHVDEILQKPPQDDESTADGGQGQNGAQQQTPPAAA